MKSIQHLVSVSGGKDSTATYLRAIELGVNFRAVFADTGNEHPATYEYVSRLHEVTGGPKVEWVRADFTARLAKHRQWILDKWPNQGVPDHLVKLAAELNTSTGNPFLDLCFLKGRFPSRIAQFCTDELKTQPIVDKVVFPMLRNGPVLQWLAIRAEESANRAKRPLWNKHDSGSYLWRPIFSWTLADVWAMHKKHGVARNSLYDQGSTRVGCMPCVNCGKQDLRQIADRFPEHIDRIRDWETVVGYASKLASATFFFFATAPSDVGTSRAGIDAVVWWSRTKHGGRELLPEYGGGCSQEIGICE